MVNVLCLLDSFLRGSYRSKKGGQIVDRTCSTYAKLPSKQPNNKSRLLYFHYPPPPATVSHHPVKFKGSGREIKLQNILEWTSILAITRCSPL